MDEICLLSTIQPTRALASNARGVWLWKTQPGTSPLPESVPPSKILACERSFGQKACLRFPNHHPSSTIICIDFCNNHATRTTRYESPIHTFASSTLPYTRPKSITLGDLANQTCYTCCLSPRPWSSCPRHCGIEISYPTGPSLLRERNPGITRPSSRYLGFFDIVDQPPFNLHRTFENLQFLVAWYLAFHNMLDGVATFHVGTRGHVFIRFSRATRVI